MATITEDYCSYEVAKLLKEKGFDIPCMGRYSVRSGEFHLDCTKMCCNGGLFEYAAPTLQMAMKWLRKAHNILLFILPAQENGKLVYLVEVWTWNEEKGIYESTYAPMPRKKPEQAVEAALKYVSENLI